MKADRSGPRRTAGFDVHGRVRHQKKDGTIIDVEVTSHAITFAGRPGRLVQAQDITARTRAEAAQQRYAERLQILHEIDRAILAEQFPEAIVAAAIGHIHALLSCWRVNISVFDFVSHQGIVLGWAGSGTPRFPVGTRLPLEEYGRQDLETLLCASSNDSGVSGRWAACLRQGATFSP